MEVSANSASKNNGGPSGSSNNTSQRRVGILYDERMCKHRTPDGSSHCENPDRIRFIWKKLKDAGITERCVILNAKEAEDKYILSVHKQKHVDLIKKLSSINDAKRHKIAEQFNSIYLSEGSSEAAYLAAGSVIEVCEKVAKGDLSSAIAIVRPPGHHAEEDKAMGFCLYNNVAIGTSFLLNKPELGINKVLIVDWDVHHGNGTQKMFWKDPRVLFFSVHRYEDGTFYPGGDDGDYTMIGEGLGQGYNINVPWENDECGDADYLAVWDHILIPVAKDFNPDIIIISAGFDAAVGDPLGDCCVTPYGYSVMLRKLMEFSQGKIVLALEGGYNLNSIANSSLACAEALLEDRPISGPLEAHPFESTWCVIQKVRKELSPFWPALADEFSVDLISQTEPTPDLSEKVAEVVQDLSHLKVGESEDGRKMLSAASSWRSEFSKIDVWYASFGSNMWTPRFLCYIEGGQVEGMVKSSPGSQDRTLPKGTMWKIVPHRLFFGRESTKTWGPGGVAVLDPECSTQDKAYICMYRITLEQFNDVLFQENHFPDTSSPLFDLNDLYSVAHQKFLVIEKLQQAWYRNVVWLGKDGDIPMLTMTCSPSNVDDFKSGKLPLRYPSNAYFNTLKRALVEGEQLREEEAFDYLDKAAREPL